jgi:hypothetical protein
VGRACFRYAILRGTPKFWLAFRASPGSGCFLKVGFEKRQGFVEIAGKLRQYVRRIRVARLFRPVDAGAGRVRDSGVALD